MGCFVICSLGPAVCLQEYNKIGTLNNQHKLESYLNVVLA